MITDLSEAQDSFHSLLKKFNPSLVPSFLKWVRNESEELLNEVSRSNEDVILDGIREDIRDSLPLSAIASSENIVIPSIGENADCRPESTVHVDGFLYEEQDVDDLCDEGKLSRNFCTKCGSKDVKPCTFLSHSMSCSQLKYLFKYVLPDLRGKNVLDVGSRLGAVLYGAYLYSNASNIVGVEITEKLCQIQQAAIEKYQMTDRVQVSCADICSRVDLLQQADVVILNNVFEFFMPVETQKSIWKLLWETVRKPGCILVVIPSLESSINSLQLDLDLCSWVEPIDVSQQRAVAELQLFGCADPENSESDFDNIYVYKVKS